MIEIHKTLVVSTAHIPPELDSLLECDAISESLVYSYWLAGWLIPVSEYQQKAAQTYKSLACLLSLAEKHHCQYLHICGDGPIVEGMDVYDWK